MVFGKFSSLRAALKRCTGLKPSVTDATCSSALGPRSTVHRVALFSGRSGVCCVIPAPLAEQLLSLRSPCTMPSLELCSRTLRETGRCLVA